MRRLPIAVAAPLALVIAALGAHAETPDHEAELLTNTRQLIYEGLRSGEGYFNADGTQMVFQSEREPDNPFYQIYLMDLETGDTRRISTGVGKTTCAWIHPDGERVLFASTHEDLQALDKQREELAKRAAGQGSRYAWSFDEHYDLYEADNEGRILRRLTDALGYDAEGSWSPDGKTILFASNRHAYEPGALSEEERTRFEQDPSAFMELYAMDDDGGNLRRLTHHPGYDGGPFFSADGKRIIWRRFEEQGKTAEIWTMNADGSEQRPITRLGALSWAPFFHPSGDYVIFATNAQGYDNFELYLVDAEGAREPVRVTGTPGFDGLPVFTPDGERLAWVSGRTPDRKAQIFIADWNDTRARELLALGPPGARTEAPEPSAPPATSPEIRSEDLRAHVEALTAEPMAGRLTGTEGSRLATEYVAGVMARIGLAPAGDMGGWLQDYAFTSGVSPAPGNRLALTLGGEGLALALDEDWRPLAFSGSGAFEPGEVVFAGYGLLAPAQDGFAGHDDYAGLDVDGKWVLVLRFLPEGLSPEQRQFLHEYAELRFKAMVARDRGARGLIVVSGPTSGVREQLVPLSAETGAGGGSLPAVSINDAAAERIFAAAGHDLGEVQRALDAGDPGPGFALDRVQVAAEIRLEREQASDRNVLGRLYAGEGPGESLIVLGAHVDHVGTGKDLDSRAEAGAGEIHPGADDNASGVAALLEIAEHLAAQKAAGKLALRHDLLFAVWTGEELGRLGSAHFAEAFAAPGAETGFAPPVHAYLNLDMVGRLDGALYVQGVGSSSIWKGELERRNVPVGLPLRLQEDSYLPTDTTSFYLRGVPVLTFFTGTHADYNTPRDTADRLNYEGLTQIARLMGLLAQGLAGREEPPDYIAQDKPKTDASRANLRAYLGTIPDYTQSDLPGVAVSGVAKGGPGEQGGLRAGDLIIEVAGRKIENIYDYTYALNALKVGQPTGIRVLRDGVRLELSVTPSSRD